MAVAAPFVPPSEEVVVFRRDRLPLDPETMTALAGQLLVLAKAQGGADESDRRAVAQLLGLAIALDPAAEAPRKFCRKFADGDQQGEGNPELVANVRTGVWRLQEWLDTADSGEDAKALAACLGDAMAVADPKHPRAGELRKQGERGAWTDWVKPAADFKLKEQIPTDRPPVTTADDPKADPKAGQPEHRVDSANPVKLEQAVIRTVAWASPSPNQPRKLMLVQMAMRAVVRTPDEGGGEGDKNGQNHDGSNGNKDNKDGSNNGRGDNGDNGDNGGHEWKSEPFSCRWENPKAGDQAGEETEKFKPVRDAVMGALTKEIDEFPKDVRVTLAPDAAVFYRVAKDPTALSGPAAVLVHAALTGIDPRAIVIGDIRKDGSFRMPVNFWERVRALSGRGGGRLVLPAEAEAILPSILVFEEPGFFLDYEVLYAADLGELVERAAKTTAGDLAGASAKFAEIRDKRGSQAVAPYVANRYVRQRLEEIARANPEHASAKMLAVQASGQRPTRLPTPILAAELLQITRTTDWIVYDENARLDADKLGEIITTGRKGLERLARVAEIRDGTLVDQTGELFVGLRTLAGVVRKRAGSESEWDGRPSEANTFKALHARITETLKLAAGGPS